MAEFNQSERLRYSRQFMLPGFGEGAQEKLKKARVLCIGAGGLGSPAATYLVAAGIGTLGLVDFDDVDLSNLHRQILHSTADVGRAKVDSASDRLRAINPEVVVETYRVSLDQKNVLEIFSDYDVILDGTDNYATRYLINDACLELKKPNVSATVFRFEGQLSIFCADNGPCYRCLFPEPPPPGFIPGCGEGGVLGVVPGVMGTLQATEAVKLIAGIGEPLIGRFLTFDTLEMRSRTLNIRRRADCQSCGPARQRWSSATHSCERTQNFRAREVSIENLLEKLEAGEDFVLLDVREESERKIDRIEQSIFIPLGEMADRISEIAPGKEVIVYCKTGRRSLLACEILAKAGFKNPASLRGGIDLWLASVQKPASIGNSLSDKCG